MKEQSEWLMIEKSEKWNRTSSIGDEVSSALKLSYDHLPSLSVQQCFASCSIFPKDTRMEKETLIQIWMAQGLINHPKGGHLEMEDIGSNYFNILMRSSLLQDPEKDIYNDIISCMMHDLVHDLSLEVSNNGFFNTDDGMVVNHDNEVMHLTVVSSQGKMLKNMEGFPPKLQTFNLVGVAVLKNIFETCRYLCVLIVQCWNITDLPNAVGDMKHLRYLDIQHTRITTLPDSITKLYNLMTLRVRNLIVIPKGFWNLINLRHIHFPSSYDGKCLFPRIGQLANLRTLPPLVVSQDKGCQIEELGHLLNLKGKLRILKLENVSSYESAAKANLSRKSNIQSLTLSWEDTRQDCGDNVLDVMEGLQPHSNLKRLSITGFNGSKLPSWMVTRNHLLALHNLVEIRLEKLDKCEEVPSFGDLPYLQILRMVSLSNVKRIGSEFYGLNNLDYPGSSGCSGEGQIATSFPALKELTLWRMYSLIEWSDAKVVPSDSSSSTKAFPKLWTLNLWTLPELAILPDMENFTCLERLSIRVCGSLTCLRNLNSLKSLESLDIRSCPNVDAIIDMNNPQSLRTVSLSQCDKLISSLGGLNNYTSLECLEITSQPGSWPKDLDHPPNLRRLYLQGFSEGIDYFPWPFSVISSKTKYDATADYGLMKQKYFVSLETLRLCAGEKSPLPGGPKITSLPEQIQHLPALTDLSISDFHGLEALPEWIGCLRNLEYLWIYGCSNLKQFPTVEAMQCLTNLRLLQIDHCPLLKERCTKGSGVEWPKIAHIPKIKIIS